MELSRKRKKELARLRSSAEKLWQEQQEVLEHASAVARQARVQANLLSQEHVVPRVLTTYESRFKPTVDRSVVFANQARGKVITDVLPLLSGVGASALSVLQLSKGLASRVDTAALAERAKAFSASFRKPEPVPVKTGPGAGTYALIGVGALALSGVAYAAWQTFRADDDLWIADDEPEATGSTNPTDVPKTPTA
ncbi:hypothetical protein [Naasia sp. SYSU D00057]|uniref:hypothetical protein n=1 Tax=Naasia sp. SYSU D00057 TaxID=2817380 RepID=UPI001B317C8A|nr:hypothetical protein [Naasia sp. SYSU D00057]